MTGHLPYYIAIEGPIGVGKTSLAKRLAETFEYELLLEEPNKNPFLDRFYENPQRHALATQLFFLFQRVEQIRTLHQNDLFKNLRIADFLIDKDMLFAQQNLDKDEYNLYGQIYDHLTINAPKPNLIIYLQASTAALLERIKERGVASEQLIELDYLDQLNNAYAEFFHYYKDSSLLIVNTEEFDPIHSEPDYKRLIKHIQKCPNGTHYFNPTNSLL
tara:strand:+ start:23993 stop:24643 length:651 start_codon:yes stop_codon:yes gene_type:complete